MNNETVIKILYNQKYIWAECQWNYDLKNIKYCWLRACDISIDTPYGWLYIINPLTGDVERWPPRANARGER